MTVAITPGHPMTASPDPVVISLSRGDQVQWVCPNCASGFRVHFAQTSTFAITDFDDKHPDSGKV